MAVKPFSKEVQSYIQRQFERSQWDRCDHNKGFLLSDLLMCGVQEALAKNQPPVDLGEIDDVAKIQFTIRMTKQEGKGVIVTFTETAVAPYL